MTLQECKDQIARNLPFAYNNWNEMNLELQLQYGDVPGLQTLNDQAAELYASQFKAEIAASRDLNHELILKLAAAAPQFKSKDNIPEPDFWKRLESFVKEVQVNDPMSEEEKEMILKVANRFKGL